ncbi:hypothetical protein NQZ79_g1521 [Umbelopsis isabellina]|nr:hypothetical protein NQZ79_g1521 [Umbelopsis isabellina]
MEAVVNPGEVLTYDFRYEQHSQPKKSLKVLQWNVERNYKPQEIIETLKRLDPDIAIVQEIDICCKRSGNADHMKNICMALGWKGGFVAEFLELESPIRLDQDQGGGVHGNAIFSKYNLEFRVVNHKYHPYNWEADGEKLREPRIGRRYTLAAQIEVPGMPSIMCYCVHLEVFCGIIGRVSAFSDVLADARNNIDKIPHQLLFGDLNTMAHSIARLSPKYATDRYRLMSLGRTESQWWKDNVLSWQDRDGPINMHLSFCGFRWLYKIYSWCCKFIFGKSKSSYASTICGFQRDVLQAARNPGFTDCWPCNMTTLTNYGGVYKARLDWTLTRQFQVLHKEIGNMDYSASDHAYLMVHVQPQ